MSHNLQNSYQVSKYYRGVPDSAKSKALVYHSIFGKGLVMGYQLKHLLDNLSESVFFPEEHGIVPEITAELEKRNIIIREGYDEEKYIEELISAVTPFERISHLRLCMSENCNMSCTYCYVDCKTKYASMPYEVAERAIKGFFQVLRKSGNRGDITFFGGEPLLNWDVIQRSVRYVRKNDPERKIVKKMSIVSNGTLIDKEKIDFLKSNSVFVSISYDGPKNVHNKVRFMKSGEGSYDAVIKGVEAMIAAEFIPGSLVCTIGDHNVNSIKDVVSFASEKNFYLSVNDAFAEPRSNVYSVSDDEIISNLYEALKHAQNIGVNIDGTWKWAYEGLFEGAKSLRHCVASGGELSVDCDGNIKPCPGFDVIYGTVDDMEGALKSDEYKRISSRLVPRLKECRGCDIEGLCAGGCMLNASKVNNGDIFRKSESCYLFKSMFDRLVEDYLENYDKPKCARGMFKINSNDEVSVYSDHQCEYAKVEKYVDFIKAVAAKIRNKFKLELIDYNIYLISEGKRFSAIANNMIPDWATCYVYQDSLIQKISSSPLEKQSYSINDVRGIAHELGHIVTYKYSKLLPSWLSEGISEYIANELCPESQYDLKDNGCKVKLDHFLKHPKELLISYDTNSPLSNKLYFEAYLYVKKILAKKGLKQLLNSLVDYDGSDLKAWIS